MTNEAALAVQIGGNHYKNLKIQPIEYIHANNIPYPEGNIIKYATRWRDKGGLKDLQKIKHYVDLIITLEGLEPPAPKREPFDLYNPIPADIVEAAIKIETWFKENNIKSGRISSLIYSPEK